MAVVEFAVKNPSLGEDESLKVTVDAAGTLADIKASISKQFPGNPAPDQLTVRGGAGLWVSGRRSCVLIAGCEGASFGRHGRVNKSNECNMSKCRRIPWSTENGAGSRNRAALVVLEWYMWL